MSEKDLTQAVWLLERAGGLEIVVCHPKTECEINDARSYRLGTVKSRENGLFDFCPEEA